MKLVSKGSGGTGGLPRTTSSVYTSSWRPSERPEVRRPPPLRSYNYYKRPSTCHRNSVEVWVDFTVFTLNVHQYTVDQDITFAGCLLHHTSVNPLLGQSKQNRLLEKRHLTI